LLLRRGRKAVQCDCPNGTVHLRHSGLQENRPTMSASKVKNGSFACRQSWRACCSLLWPPKLVSGSSFRREPRSATRSSGIRATSVRSSIPTRRCSTPSAASRRRRELPGRALSGQSAAEVRVPQPASTFRVVAVGDSLTEEWNCRDLSTTPIFCGPRSRRNCQSRRSRCCRASAATTPGRRCTSIAKAGSRFRRTCCCWNCCPNDADVMTLKSGIERAEPQQ